MEVLFENNHERTPEVTKEIYRFTCFKRPVHIVIYIILGIVALWNIVAAFWFWDFTFTPIAYAFLFLLIQFIIYQRSVSVAIARDREQYGPEPLRVNTVVTEEGIQCTYGENKANTIALSNIKKVYKTKNLIMLLTKARLLLVYDKNKFTVGTTDEFLQYLRSKGLKA